MLKTPDKYFIGRFWLVNAVQSFQNGLLPARKTLPSGMALSFTSDVDAVVVGSGPNGLAAAIVLQQAGVKTLLLEAKATIGGGMRTQELTLPGFKHDVCSAVLPMAADSPFFRTLPLAQYGLRFLNPPVAAAHPFDNGPSACLFPDVAQTAATLGQDNATYQALINPLLRDWPTLAPLLLGPLRIPKNPFPMARFGLKALLPATTFGKWFFRDERARGFWAGMGAHSIQALEQPATSAIALVLLLAGHARHWPLPAGGAQSLADALAAHFWALGGQIETNTNVASLAQLPASRAVLLDVTPRQLLALGGFKPSTLYGMQLRRFRYGPGVFKMDWALDGPVPWRDEAARQAGTVHLGATLPEIAQAERDVAQGRHPARPFVLVAQPSVVDASRAPAGKSVLWAYCHVPNGSRLDQTEAIERQIERFAPGFRERILQRSVMNTARMEDYNANYIGGDINGGAQRIDQIFTRPALRSSPYRTSTKGIYLCSSSTPPGGGVHGMCGYWAAQRALRDCFGL